MTNANMALLEPVEQVADGDLVREMLAFAVEHMMDLHQGISPRSVDDLVKAMRGTGISKS